MKTPDPTKAQSSAPNSAKFTGTDNPRHLRAIAALLRRPISRQELDSVAGCANSPALVSDLRDLGLGDDNLQCERIEFTDRDGHVCRPGVYSFSEKGRRMIYAWMAKRTHGGVNGERSQ